jgi:hypothetical protein
MKKIRTVAMVVVVGLFLTLWTGNAFAALWRIKGVIVRAGMQDGQVYVVLKDDGGNLWGAGSTPTLAKEILATALTAISSGTRVMATFDTSEYEWSEMMVATE